MAPFLDLGLGHVLDGHLEPVSAPDARVHDSEASFSENRPHLTYQRELKHIYREAINDGQIDRLFKGILNQYVKGVAGRYDKKDLNLTIARYVN